MNTQRDDDSAGGDSVGEDRPGGTPEEHPETRRPRGRRLTVVAVAATVLLAGGGGAWWAASADGSGGSGKSAAGSDGTAVPAPWRLDGPDGSVRVTGGGPDSGTGTGTGPADGGGSTYQLTGTLPKGPASAPVYRASAGVDQAALRKLAGLLGVSGPVTSDSGSWRVGGTPGGGGPALLVGKDAPGTWSYSRNGATAHPGATAQDRTTPSADSAPVSEARAKAVAAPVLDGLGLSGARTDAGETVGALRTVTADPMVDGLPTHGWTTSLRVGPDGTITLGYGRLAALTKGVSYPVVGAAEALKELNATPVEHPDYGIASCRVPVRPLKPGTPPRPQSTTSPVAPSPTASPTTPGQDKTLPRSLPRDIPCVPNNGHPVQVRGASFGLALEYASGAQTLVPAWLFDTAPAGVTRTSVVARPALDPASVGNPVPTGPASPGPTVNPGGPVVPNGPHKVAVSGYRASGDTLTVSFWGGVCDTYKASASESGGQVRVTVTATAKKPGAICPMIARSDSQKVVLDHPLGTRTVVDASDGQPVKGQ